MDLIMDIY